MFLRALVSLLACASVGLADDKKPPIRIPTINVKEDVPPKPLPADATVSLPKDVWYIVESDVECLVFLSPGGSVGYSKDTGPIKLKGRFADGKGTVETRTYAGKFIYTFEAIKEGRDELIILPVGAQSEKEAVRVTFQVGQMPQPPPNPVDPDKPVVVTSFRVVLVNESGTTLSAAQNSVLFGKAIADYLDQKCTKQSGQPGWRRYDKNTDASKDLSEMAALWAAVQPKLTAIPCLVVEVNGKADILPFPTSVADALATLKKYGGN